MSGRGELASLAILAGAAIVALVLIDTATRSVPVYLTPDAGHYLEDARALFGDGVRDNRHLPLFPLLLGIIGWFTTDLVALRVSITLVVLAAIGAFFVFVRGRLGSRVGEAVGAAVFALSSVYAEAVGWYGGAMLLGVVLTAVALRAIDKLLEEPSRGNALLAGVAVGAIGLTHPFWVLVTAQVTVAVMVVTTARAVVGPQPDGRRPLTSAVKALAVSAAVAVAIVLPVRSFYLDVDNPVELSASTTNLGLLENWAFREAPAFGLVVLVGLAVLVATGRRLAGERGQRFAVWIAAIAFVVLANLVLVSGDPTFTNRIIYAVPFVSGAAVGAIVAWVVALARRGAGRPWTVVAAAVLTLAVFVAAAQMFDERLDAAIPYFNHVAPLELEALDGLRGRDGAVLVAPRADDDPYAAGLYAWMFEGLLRRRTIGPAYAAVNLFERGIAESDDAARLVAGAEVVERSGLQVGYTPGRNLPAHVSVRAADVWSRVVSIEEASNAVPRPGPGGGLVVDLAGPPGAVTLAVVRLPTGLPDVRLDGDTARLTVRVGTTSVRVVLRAAAGRFERDSELLGADRLKVVPTGPGPPALEIRVPGSDERDQARRFSERALIAKYRFRHAIAWSGTAELERLLERDCFRRADANDVVTVLAIPSTCWSAPAR